MKKRFIVAVENLTPKEQSSLSDFFSEQGGWWHWIDGIWLVVVSRGSIDTVAIRNKVNEISGSKSNCIVLQVSDTTAWAGYGPKTPEKNMFDWIHNQWDISNDL